MEMALSSSYEAAMEALSSLISGRKRGDGSKRSERFDLMLRYLKMLDLEERICGLKIIHVAGTKGKGSTCTFSEAILRECGFRTGLFTSPHLIDVTERYRINGFDISKDDFLHYFWDCWNQLKERSVDNLPMPPLFQFLTLLAFKIFLSEKVDVAILEVGIGGKLDCTNVVQEPVVCGITSLGMDHMEILGDSIEKIAYEKAGIFKPNVPAFTVFQLPEAMSVLREIATELMIPLEVAKPLDSEMLNNLKLGLDGDHQLSNAGLAVALCKCWLQRTRHSKHYDVLKTGLPEAFLRGLSTACLPGRAQIITDKREILTNESGGNEKSGELVFYLDGAHTPESMEVCARWFSNTVKDDQDKEVCSDHSIPNLIGQSNRFGKISKKILLFNCMEVRDPKNLLPQLINICSSNDVRFSKIEKPEDLSTSRSLNGEELEKCIPVGKHLGYSSVIPSLPLALKWLRTCAEENPSLRLQVLVTGSIHLVGDVLKLLKR